MQYRPEGCILCNPPVCGVEELCQIPVERPSIRVLFPLLWVFSSSSGLYKIIKSSYLSLVKAQCNDTNLPRCHAPNVIFTTGLVDGKRYTDSHVQWRRKSLTQMSWSSKQPN